MWFSFFFHIVGTSSFCVDETAGSTYLVCLFMQNLALLKMNKDHNQKVFIMQSIQKKPWMKSSSNKVISWHCITKYNLGHLPLWCVHFSFSYDCQLSLKMGCFRLLFWGGWSDLLDLDFTWVVAVGGSSFIDLIVNLGFFSASTKQKHCIWCLFT